MKIIELSILAWLKIVEGKTIGKKIVGCLQDWDIEKLLAIIVNNANTNDVVVSYVNIQLLI